MTGVESRNAIANSAVADSLYSQAIWSVVSGIPVINTYTDLKNAGQTNLISDENIRIKFTSLENSLYELKDQVDDRLNYQQMHCDSWAIENQNFVRITKLRANAIYPDMEPGPENDYVQMFNDQKFLNVIAGKLTMSDGVIRDRNALHEEIIELIDLVEIELEN